MQDSPCSRNPCKNGGVCTYGDSSDFKCTCKNGYTGKNCEVKPSGPVRGGKELDGKYF